MSRADSLLTAIKRDALHHLHGSFFEFPVAVTPIRLARMLLSPEFHLVLDYRIYSWLHQHGMQRLAQLLYLYVKSKHRCDIAPQARIGPGLRVVHCQDIVIGPDAILGEDVVIFNGVSLGKRKGRDGIEGMPSVGARVLLGSGAKLLGRIFVGDGALVGANAVVLESIPAHATVVGNPARLVEGDQDRTQLP